MKRLILLCILFFASAVMAAEARYVIFISVDGMGSSYLSGQLEKLPSMARIVQEGAGTLNARSDYDYTVTLPNHTCMVTGRPVVGDAEHPGHGWTNNTDPPAGATLHSHRGQYVAGVFDVVHDHGGKTGLWSGKTKFALFSISYNDASSATAPSSQGTTMPASAAKLDAFVYDKDANHLTSNFIATQKAQPYQYSFVHFADPDSAGHSEGWGSQRYNQALITVDQCIGQILDLVQTDQRFKGHTTIILTADHGGFEKNHGDNALPLDYTIPFYVWGAGVRQGDLYLFNAQSRKDPGTGRVDYSGTQPIRNGDAPNLALKLLDMPAIEGSSINAKQDLQTQP